MLELLSVEFVPTVNIRPIIASELKGVTGPLAVILDMRFATIQLNLHMRVPLKRPGSLGHSVKNKYRHMRVRLWFLVVQSDVWHTFGAKKVSAIASTRQHV